MKTSSNRRLNAALIVSLLVAALSLGAHRAQAQASGNPPNFMTYQGFLVDANGTALGTNAPKNYDVIFRLWDAPSGGATPLWAEQQTVTVDKGYFSVLLGEGSSIGEPRPGLSTLFTNNTASDRWVGITVKGIGAGGADANILPRLRLLTSPYSFLAQKAINVDAAGLTSGTVPDARLSANVALRAGGNTFSGDQFFTAGLYMDNQRILSARNFAGTYENVFWPRWSDNVTYMNFGAGGFNIRNNISISRMFLTDAGNVGIGSTSPGSSLEVVGGIRARGGAPGAGGGNNNGYAFSNGGDNDSGMFSTADGLIQFFTDSTEKMRINTVGNVGIGTTSPGSRLHVVDSTYPTARIESSSTIGTWMGIGNSSSGGRSWQFISTGSGNGEGAGKLLVGSGTSAGSLSAIPMTLQSDGRVGLGTSFPGATLHIIHTVNPGLAQDSPFSINRSTTGASLLLMRTFAAGAAFNFELFEGQAYKPGGGSWGAVSDERLKKNVRNLEGALDSLLRLRSVSFEFKDPEAVHERPGRHNGFIAQEVENVFPEWVSPIADGMKAVAPVGFESLTVQALRELRAEKDAQIKALREQNAALEKRLAELETNNQERDNRLAAVEKFIREKGRTGANQASYVPDGK